MLPEQADSQNSLDENPSVPTTQATPQEKWLGVLLAGMSLLLIIALVRMSVASPLHILNPADLPASTEETSLASNAPSVVADVDEAMEKIWDRNAHVPARQAEELQVFRRLSLVLHGTIPSVEEIRRFQADTRAEKWQHWIDERLADPRFANYFAERLARVYVGADIGQFIIYRRDRYKAWLIDQLATNRPYNELVYEMISASGLWTSQQAANFVTSVVDGNTIDYNELTGRSVRAFLGQRIDCAECHDHPFADWKQDDFEGLAAFYGSTQVTIAGVEDSQRFKYTVKDADTLEDRVIAPKVPFHPEWLPETGTSRERLAGWVTHPENTRFTRATVNRVWGLMFGVPYSMGGALPLAVDDMLDPEMATQDDPIIDLLANDFREHNYDLRHLIRNIAMLKAFQLDSLAMDEQGNELVRSPTDEQDWSIFPLTRLRPEQVIGSMLQSTALKTIDQDSHVLSRTIKFFREIDFVKEYGDLGDDELNDRTATIPQALLRMNGRFSSETLSTGPFNATGRIAALVDSPQATIETCFLMTLTRTPTKEEKASIQELFGQQGTRAENVEDLCWALFNSPEFGWLH